MIVTLYLVAIVVANLTVAAFGPSWSIANAFLLIGFDLTARDRLHIAWRRRGLRWKMALLIAAGSLISWLLNRDAGQIALASAVAFGLAATADAVVFHLARRRERTVQVMASNTVGAAVDSLVFPTLAFGGLMPWITLGQFAAKVAGGWIWLLILRRSGAFASRETAPDAATV